MSFQREGGSNVGTTGAEEPLSSPSSAEKPEKSITKRSASSSNRIISIRSRNLAGMSSIDGRQDILIEIKNGENFTAITGETGSGKSLLVSRVIQLIGGGKASSSLVSSSEDRSVSVGITFLINEEYQKYLGNLFDELGIKIDFKRNDAGTAMIDLERTIELGTAKTGAAERLKSTCRINNQAISLKNLATIASPLFACIDAAAASLALTKSSARMAMIDHAVSPEILSRARQTTLEYRVSRKERERLMTEISSRVLPTSFDSSLEGSIELMNHWIRELDAYEDRIASFIDLLQEDELGGTSLGQLQSKIKTLDWMSFASVKGSAHLVSSELYESLCDLQHLLQSMDAKMMAVSEASALLGSRYNPESATHAIEEARKKLYQATGNEMSDQVIFESAEECHERLNEIETKLSELVRFMEDDDESRGLSHVLRKTRSLCPVSLDSLNELLVDWKSLARKHGISATQLPLCHASLRKERDGKDELVQELEEASEREKDAKKHWMEACDHLTLARTEVGHRLSVQVTRHLVSLGMGDFSFEVEVKNQVNRDEDTVSDEFPVGWDEVNFVLKSKTDGNGGWVQDVASAGEKCRILLALESSLPGCVGSSSSAVRSGIARSSSIPAPLPITIVYDEIDAHLGGRAAVAVSRMLLDQSRFHQIIAITHTASVAAVADLHFRVVNRSEQSGRKIHVQALESKSRREEVARMASGNVAPKEAEALADALIQLRQSEGE